ncbi:DNA-methyltransferase, partial [Caldisericum sp.]|uniref:DNA-methyltransferase n=1 Tax=Caldisericum sp. TaxID=2499687 RepID=UPI003D10F6FE
MKTIEDAKKEGVKLNEIYNCDALELMRLMPDKFVDLILTDPPYGILDHKLDRKIDWKAVSDEWARILKKDSMIVMFGRGTQLYRWASYLADLGFEFAEEIIWHKERPTSAFGSLLRIHELIVVYARGNKQIKKVRVPYEEMTDERIMLDDLKRIVSAVKNKGKEELIKYIENDFVKEFNQVRVWKHGITMPKVLNGASRAVYTLEKIRFGAVEKSIISVSREYYTMEHPTQKPLRLIERLLNLTSDEGDLVFDPFLGSGTTAVAAKKLGRNYIGSEILEEYCKIAEKRIESVSSSIFTKEVQ